MSALHSAAFLQAMADAGLAMHKPALLGDGALHRYRVATDKAGSTNGWYVLHLDEKPFGAFGSWKTGQSASWTATDYKAMSEAERKALAERMAAAKLARDTEQAAVHAAAAVRALGLWNRAKPATNDHPYLVRKQVHAFGIRELRGQLLIPVRNAEGELTSLQFISPKKAENGRDKTFLTGGKKRGCYHAIGRPDAALCICEGYATGASIFMATGHATAIAFDALNIEPVARAIRGKFPGLAMVICADNDTETPGNPGLTAATKAAQAVGAALAVPHFGGPAHV